MELRSALKLVLVLACIFAAAEARRRGRGRGQGNGNRRTVGQRRGGGWRPPPGNHVYWTREIDGGTSVEESAFMSSEHNVIIVRSMDNGTASQGYQTALTYYGFAGSEPIMVISTTTRQRRRPCFITTPDFTYEELMADLSGINGSTYSTVNTSLQMDGTGAMMARSDAQALSRQNPLLRRVCRRLKMFDTRGDVQPTGAAAAGASTRVLKALTFYDQVEITFPARPARVRQGRRGGRRGGRGHRRGGGGGGAGAGRGGRGGRGGGSGGRSGPRRAGRRRNARRNRNQVQG